MSDARDVCEDGCQTKAACQATFGCAPPWLEDLEEGELHRRLDFANRLQAWSFDQTGDVTFGAAAEHFRVSVEQIDRAVIAHYWMFTPDRDLPLAERRIEHDGE